MPPSPKLPKLPKSPKPAPARAWADVGSLVDWVAYESVLFAAESPFTAEVVRGDPRLVVVTGDNGSGKSLLVRVAGAKAHVDDMLPVSVSIRERTGAGGDGLRKVFMFGEEETQSTGATSVRVVQNAFNNLDRDGGTLLVLDEPETGLAEGFVHALGQMIGTLARDLPAACAGVLVVTHSRALVRGLAAAGWENPTWVHTRAHDSAAPAGPGTLAEWMKTEQRRSVEELVALPHACLERFRETARLLRS